MRKIERQKLQAIVDNKDWSKDNTRVEYNGDLTDCDQAFFSVYLHGHKIAVYYPKDQTLYINHCGWKTVTTKSRLNALISFVQGGLSGIYQKNFEWFVKRVDNGDGSVHEYPMPNAWLLV